MNTRLSLPVLCLSVAASTHLVAQTPRPPAHPTDAVAAVLDALRSHQLVAIGDDHGNEQVHAFRLALIRDPGFPNAANDIVVEFGSTQYQDVIDRFMRDEDVPYQTLREVWQNTTQPEYEWDLPIYEEFFRAVRGVNGGLPPARKVRVILGDPAIDWTRVPETGLLQWVRGRDTHAVDVIRREVLDKGRHALVIYGTEHLARKNTVIGAADEWAPGLVGQLERAGVTHAFTVAPETHRDFGTAYPLVAKWPVPSLATLSGTDLGASVAMGGPEQRPVPMEEQFDAVLFLGPMATMTQAKLAPALCADSEYMRMRLERLAMAPPPPGVDPGERLRAYCANPDGREVADRDTQLTELVRGMIREAAGDGVNPSRIAPEARERLIPMLGQIGVRFLRPAGVLESLTLLSESLEGGIRMRRYRATFASGQRVIWNVKFSAAGLVASADPMPE